MRLNRRQVRHPYHRRQVIRQNMVDGAPVVFAPNGRGLYPVGSVGRGVLLKKELANNPVRIAFQRQWASGKMWYEKRRDAGVIVDHLSFGETGRRIEHLVQIRQRQMSALN